MMRRASGVLDGIGLSNLMPGLTYDLPASVALYLVQQRAASEVSPDTPGAVVSFGGSTAVDRIAGGIAVSHTNPPAIAVANDRPSRRKRRKTVG